MRRCDLLIDLNALQVDGERSLLERLARVEHLGAVFVDGL